MQQNDLLLLINPIRIRPVVGPIAFDYLGYTLKRAGYAIDLIDSAFIDVEKALDQYFNESQPLAIGITVRNTDTCMFQGQAFFLDEIKELIAHLKTIQTTPIILGGVGFSIAPEAIMNYCGADFGIRGDGEDALLLFLKAVHTKDFTKVPNLIYRQGNQLIWNPIKFVDLKNFQPPRDLIDNPRYFEEGGQGNLETKRGCDQKCIYCADPICKGREIRLKDPKSVCAEFKALITQGVNCFHLCDSEFNNTITHAKEVCREIITEGLQTQMTWYTYCVPAPFDEELAQLMKEAGCVGINFGVDSGDDEMLRRLRRSHRIKDIIRTAKLCKENDIIVMYDLLIGAPGETQSSVKNTIELMQEVRPDRAGFSIGVRVYPRTELAQIVQEEGQLSKNPNLFGEKENNPYLLKPIFYLSSEMGGESIFSFISQLVGKDPIWFFADPDAEANYNYNENQVLVDAIRKGYRGAYWDILRRMSDAPL
ncbi:MAG: radical SAM protein [Candidatus Helarchaeota archaeon]|nr:radical SAM protein [Candidatus Helarchaeota archaeon]